ncbi:MAG: class I SAM-dependent methyltransferase [Chitinophagaceae bacterium]|nr:MAG: class I SAM-dependent methyltransferase [Chitinophagaceae bacterium]
MLEFAINLTLLTIPALYADGFYYLANSHKEVYYICSVFNKLQLLRKYLHYYYTAYNGKGHGMHSPFVYDFIIHVLNDKTAYADYARVETVRRRLLSDHTMIQVKDLGAGSSKNNHPGRRVNDIAKHAAKPRKFGQLLYRMVRYYHPGQVIELGTSLGITTQYLALASPTTTIVTMEGADEVADIALEEIRKAGLINVQLLRGNFDELLPAQLAKKQTPGLVFIDGNHRKEPTIRYFEQLAAAAGNDTILVFDDIHWSTEMEEAWEYIRQHPSTRCCIDLFFIGIVLFRQEFREKQDFVIRF